MARLNKKQTFLGGAAVLAMATAIVKLIGALYKIPLQHLIGNEGFGYFNTAYDIYSVLLMISTTGLPVAMSRMISEAKTLGQTRQIKRIFRTSLMVFLAIGFVGTGGMMLLCRQLAAMMSQEESWFAILCLSPAVLFICLISAERGFFQGQANMVPTSLSQILEALCKLVIGLGAAYLIQTSTGSVVYASGGAILGVTAGTVAATVFLAWRRRGAARELDDDCPDPTVYSHKSTAKKLLSIAIPITIGAAGLQFITLVDAAVYMARLKGAAGMEAQADNLKGIYNFCQTIFNLPCAFITPLTVSVIPALTEQLTLRRPRRANTVSESATRVMSLIAMPCAIGLVALAGPILKLLGSYEAEELAVGVTLLSILGVCVFFNCFVLLMNAMMQAHGYVYIPVMNMILGGIAKIIVNYVLVGNPRIHIVGAPIGTLVCYVIIAGLDYFAIRRVLRHPPRLLQNLVKPAVASLVMGGAALLVRRLLEGRASSTVLILILSIGVAGLVYVALVLALRIITADDCRLLPKGDKIARLLRIR